MSDIHILIVCLPKATPTDKIAASAGAALAAHGFSDAGPAGHFLARTRLRTGRLLQPGKRTAAGGPVRLLDLARMRSELSRRYWNRWQLWHQIVAGSPAARPWWHFYDRYTANPTADTRVQARHGFASQPRVTRMLTYNSHPGRLCDLPLEHLDAFEAGPHAYAAYGWLQAVPGDSMLSLDGQILRPASARHSDQLQYLRQANEYIAALAGADVLAAIAAT